MRRCGCGLRSILVVDDDESIRNTLAELLAEEGCKVATAADGASALNCLRQQHACLVLLDLMMPGISGWQLMAFIIEDRELSQIPICIISAVDTRAPMGAAKVLSKPLHLDRLLAVVDEYCPVGPRDPGSAPAASSSHRQ